MQNNAQGEINRKSKSRKQEMFPDLVSLISHHNTSLINEPLTKLRDSPGVATDSSAAELAGGFGALVADSADADDFAHFLASVSSQSSGRIMHSDRAMNTYNRGQDIG